VARALRSLFSLIVRAPPPRPTFFPYTTLFRSGVYCGVRAGLRAMREAAGSVGFLLFLCGSACIWILFAVRQPLFTQWDEFTAWRSEEHTSELQSRFDLVCRLLLEKKKNIS